MEDKKDKLNELRCRMTHVNEEIMNHLNEFFQISNNIGQVKDGLGMPHFDPVRESEMLREIREKNKGPMPYDLMKRIFKDLFRASVEEMGVGKRKRLEVNRMPDGEGRVVVVNGLEIGGQRPVLIAGPCAVESYEQLHTTAKTLHKLGIRILRGGAFKPRTSPYSFQGLEETGLKILRRVADEFHMAVISEVLDTRSVSLVAEYADILQVGTRNMFNYALLKELGRIHKPVMIKRGLMATIDEFILAAEYVYIGGNHEIILCERGIRTYETQTRNTLDISCIPILAKETALPVIVDISHSLGRKDIIKPMARAALSAGAHGIMFESHYDPKIALSDSEQQLDLRETEELVRYLEGFFELS